MDEQESLLPLSDLQKQMLEEATEAYAMELAFDARVQDYLEARGFSPETVGGARLGVVSRTPAPEHESWLAGWLSIPYLGHRGQPLAMRFRCLKHLETPGGCKGAGHSMKYTSVAGEPTRTYNVGALHAAARGRNGDSSIQVCEGELDALILQQCGLHAIAIPGARHWQPRHRKMLAGFNEIHVWADQDDAGREFAGKVTRSLRNARTVRLPDGQDVGETYVQVQQDGLLKILRGE